MYTYLAIGSEFITEFFPFLMVLIFFRRKRGRPFTFGHYAMLTLFALYIMAVYHVTGAGTIYDAMRKNPDHLMRNVNLIPFSQSISPLGYGLNVVMFVPFGFLVPLIWRKREKFWQVFAAGLGFSLLIELSQLLCYRGTDVDDLIMNTLGAIVGFLLFKAWDKLTKSKCRLYGTDAGMLSALIFSIYLGRCLLFNQLGLIHLIYGW